MTESAVDPLTVVEHFDELNHRGPRFRLSRERAVARQPLLERGPEAFRERVVVAVGHAAHARDHAPGFELRFSPQLYPIAGCRPSIVRANRKWARSRAA